MASNSGPDPIPRRLWLIGSLVTLFILSVAAVAGWLAGMSG
jgi:hypothetical protein